MGVQTLGKEGTVADINVVPLIDILLVLLIIFMVITPLVPKGLAALVPQPGEPSDESPVVVHVGAGWVKINQQEIPWDALEARLATIFKSRAEKVAFVQGEGPVEFKQVARAISVMRSAGIEKVGLLTARVGAAR
ncbi:MAG TPA: biopolymer transporter ExbD [Candidatus Acidoferrales bacterium]|jgi:biopolymer transport protein ExbD|nr:biopolymer transporter ExbD [Candidatus Acidoferrales bacterium]